jgi:hypothetical protein
MNAQATQQFPKNARRKSWRDFQNRRRLAAYLPKMSLMEAAMPSASRKARYIGAASSLAALIWAGSSLASQGPGTSIGTACHFTQVAMAVLVYGISALVVGAGLIGALRRH